MDRIWAALIFFTRLPFWRLHEPPKECYQTVVEHWPLVGWLTGGIMAGTLWLSSLVFPYPMAVLLAIVMRMLVTGALHEDGLADFLDGFGGGGNNRPFAKMLTSQLVSMMPYARREEEAKAKVVYRKISVASGISLAVQGLVPIALFIWYTGVAWETMIFIPALVMYFLYLLIWRKIQGYTGDCCGAVCLLVELSVYLTLLASTTLTARL